MKKITILALFLGLFLTKFAQAQTVSDCIIDYKIDINSPDMDAMTRMMMSNATMKMSFLEHKSRIDMNMMAMMKSSIIADSKTKKSIVLMSMMGKKMAFLPEEDELEANANFEAPDAKVTKTGKTKKIAGYECAEYTIVTEEGDKSTMWVTDKIQPVASTQYTYKGVSGFPLEMTVNQDGNKMKMVASKVRLEKPNADQFSTDVPAGYEIQSREDLEKMGKK